MAKAKQKILLSKGFVTGGLYDLKQKYEIFYLGKEKGYSDKISVELTLIRENDDKKYARRSIRFSTCSEFKSFINNCIEALAIFERKRNILRTENLQLISGARISEFGKYYMRGVVKQINENK